MELQHTFTVPADVDTAWNTLLDLEGVAPCFPGATLTGVNGDEFSGQVKVKLGPVSLQYAGKGRFLEKDDAAHRAVIEANGSDKRGNGTAGAMVVASMEAESPTTTRVTVETQLKITGRPAQFGRGVMQDVGSRIVDQFAGNLARQLADDRPAPVAAPEASPAASAPAASAPAASAPAAAAGASDAALSNGTANGVGTPASVAASSAAASSAPARPPVASPSATGPVTGPLASPAAPVRPAAPRPSAPARDTDNELDLNSVVLPVLARQYGPTVVAVLVTAVLTWIVARRRR